jgi:1-acyl-sn-glycerol-3-phosphate acyltransferase
MKLFRVTIRIPALILVSAFWYLLWVVGKLSTGLLPKSGRSVRRRWRKIALGGWGRSLAAIMGMRIKTTGQPPQPPFLLVSNHLSYVDIIAYASCLECVFVSRGDVANWPGVGLLSRSIGTIFINREKMQDIPRVIGEMNAALDAGQGVILFPEGTSGAGDRILPFHPSLLDPAAKANYPVSYASIQYQTPPDEPPAYMAVSWWGDMTFAPHFLDLLKLSGFDSFITFGTHAIRSDDRKTLAKSLWGAVNEQFSPMVDSSLVRGEKEAQR